MSDKKHDDDTDMTYDDLINQWFEKSRCETDVFTRFIFLYFSFIAFLTQQLPRGNDSTRIDRLKKSKKTREHYLSLLQGDEAFNATIMELKAELSNRPLVNVTGLTNHNATENDGALHDVDDWENLVEYWYRVRNNLFHARKAPGVERDKRLVYFANLTLTPLMEYFIEVKQL